MKQRSILVLLLLSLTLLCSCGRAAHAKESAGDERLDPATFAPYADFGLTVDETDGQLYYNGQLVHRFDDQSPAKGFRTKAVGVYQPQGVVDIQALRDETDHQLTGLEVVRNTDAPGDDYAAFGLELREGAYYYQGQQVRLLWDSRNQAAAPAESEKPLLDSLSNWDAGGTVDVYAVRDFAQRDAQGYGTLTGLRVASAEEFAENTAQFGGVDGPVERAAS